MSFPIRPCILLILTVFTGSLIGACNSKSTPSASTPARRTVPYGERNIVMTDLNADIINYVNEYRATKKLRPLKLLPTASAQAAIHSRDMATGKVKFGHDGFKQRAIVIANELKGSSATGENVAYGRMTAREVVDTWLKSAGHRANIEGNFDYTGVGVAKDAKGVVYYTQMFVKK